MTQSPAVRVVRDRTIRVKVIDDCGLACTFCHNEGTPVTADNKGRTLLPFVSGPGGTGRVSIYSKTNGVNFLSAKIRAAEQTVRAAVSNGVKVSVNIVVPGPAHVDRVVNLVESYGQFADVRMLTSIQDGAESIAAISEVLARVGAEPVLRTFTAGTSDERTLYRALGGRAVYVKRLLPVRLPETCATCRFNNDTDCEEGYYGIRLYLTDQGEYMVGVCIQRMDLCLPVTELPTSGIVEEVQAFKDAEVRRLTSEYGAVA
ncbi:hypothetical protein [Kitasatospora purpeofusca]|uniref:hypothetical protein n=1 Tax=Kitasatospora purpeofusca TaxID=67352 RepID=UPI00386C1F9E|nr:hypothetical protein OIP63_19115 [Kitasatospora purpeofusca]